MSSEEIHALGSNEPVAIVSTDPWAPVGMKAAADDENEVTDVVAFRDAGSCHVTAVATLSPSTMKELVETLSQIVRERHRSERELRPNPRGIIRAQTFEEGDVYMLEEPFTGFGCDRYLIDFYDVRNRDICSRMHYHTGLRFVRIMTGPASRIRISTLSALRIHQAGFPVHLEAFVDELPDYPGPGSRRRHNVVVPECSIVDMAVPRGCSHQFNAFGPYAVIDTVHPEETIEVFRESMSGLRMMAQTLFLADEQPSSEACAL